MCRLIRAGQYRHIAELLKMEVAERSANGSGQNVTTYEPVARVPCKCYAVTSTQTTASDQSKRVTGFELEMRWLRDINSNYRLRVHSFVPGEAITLRITGMYDPDGKREKIVITAAQIQPTAN